MVGDSSAPETSRRDDLLEAALRCFSEHGYAATTIEMIRERAGASVGSLYHHFGGKEQLAAALYLDRLTSYEAGYEDALAVASDAESGVRGVVAHHLSWAQEHPDDARFLLDHSHFERSLARSGELPASNRGFYRRVQKWIDAQVSAGEIRPLSADLYYAFWLGPAQELARQWLAKRSRTKPADVIEIMSEAAWSALKSEDA